MKRLKERRKIEYLTVKFILGFTALAVGLIVSTIALFAMTENPHTYSSFGAYARYVLGFAGFVAMIAGAMLLNDVWVLRGVLKGRYELPTYDAIVKAYQALYSVYLSKSKSKDETEEEEEKVKGEIEEEERVKVQVSH